MRRLIVKSCQFSTLLYEVTRKVCWVHPSAGVFYRGFAYRIVQTRRQKKSDIPRL